MASSVGLEPVVDLRGLNLGTMFGYLPRGACAAGMAHLYVLAFGGLTKVGYTNNPTSRFVQHRNSKLTIRGGFLRRAWVSEPHPNAVLNEKALIRHCHGIGGSKWWGKHEIFLNLGLKVEEVIAFAASLPAVNPQLEGAPS
jgi:hypothetical protein